MSNNYPGDSNPYGTNQNGTQGGYQQNAGYDQNQQGYGQPAAQGAYDQGSYGGYQSFPSDQNQLVAGANRPGAWKRFLGYLIDSILIGIITSAVTWIFFGKELNAYFQAIMNMEPSSTPPEEPIGALALSGLLTLVLWFGYRVGMEVKSAGTLGKMAIGAKVSMEDGSPITVGSSFKRNSWYLLNLLNGILPAASLIILGVLGVTIGRDSQKQSFTDKWAKAIVTDK